MPQAIAAGVEVHASSEVYQPAQTDDEDTESENATSKSTRSRSSKKSVTANQPRSRKSSQKKGPDDPPRWFKKLELPALTRQSQENSDKEKLKRQYGGESPAEIFSLFCDDNLLNQIVQYSVNYAHQDNYHGFKLTTAELTKFFGILILRGYHSLYWSRTEDCGIELVQITMSRNRFREIKKYLHFCDNNSIDKNDKFAKVRLLIDSMNEKNLQFGIFSEDLSIDEEMIPYFGRHSAKMFIKGKIKSNCFLNAFILAFIFNVLKQFNIL